MLVLFILKLNILNLHKIDTVIHPEKSITLNNPFNLTQNLRSNFIVIETQKGTENTCVCFYQYDHVFDGIHGLYNSIIYQDKERLEKFRERFKNVKYIIVVPTIHFMVISQFRYKCLMFINQDYALPG